MNRSTFTNSQNIDALKWVDSDLAVKDIFRVLGFARKLSINSGPRTALWIPRLCKD